MNSYNLDVALTLNNGETIIDKRYGDNRVRIMKYEECIIFVETIKGHITYLERIN